MSIATFIAAGIAIMAALVAARRRGLAERDVFVLLMVAIGAWSCLDGLHSQTADTTTRVTLASLEYTAVSSVPLLLLLVARQAAGLSMPRPPTIALLATIPIVSVGLAWTNRWHGWIWRQVIPVGPALVYVHGPWFWVATTYDYLLLIAAMLTLLHALRRTPAVFRTQLSVLLIAILLPWGANVLYLTGAIPVPGLDITPFTFALTGPIILWALIRHRLLDLMPIARDALIDQLDDGVIILDDQQRIVDFNPAAARLAGLTARALGDVLPQVMPALAPTLVADSCSATVVVEACGPTAASLAIRATPIHRPRGQLGGWLVVLHDITVQQRLARRLREERDFALQVMQTMGEGLTVTDAHGRFTFVNHAYAHLFGYAPADLLGHSPFDLTLDADHETLGTAHAARMQGQVSTYMSRLRCADGRIVTVQITGVPRMVDGQFAGAIAVVTDLSERLAAEAALREAEQRFRSMFERHQAIMLLVEPDSGTIVDANAAAAAFYGYPLTDLRGMNIAAINQLAPEQVVNERALALAEQRNVFCFPHRLASGDIRTVEVHSTPITVGAQVLLFSIIHDITARTQAEAALRASEQRWQFAMDAVNDGLWDWNVPTGAVFFSDRWQTMLGYTPGEVAGHVRSWEQLVHPDDLPRVMATLQDHLDGKTPWYECEHRCRTKGGDWRWILDRGQVIRRDATGRPLRAVGTHTDVSERRALEEELRAARDRYAFQASHDPLTGLLNRHAITTHVVAELARANRSSYPLSLALLDIDHFKAVNDWYGHLSGDQVLCHVAQILTQVVRPYDWVGRWGGEEFLVVLSSTPLDAAALVAERLRTRIMASPLRLADGTTIALTASIGVACTGFPPDDPVDPEGVFQQADAALYAAKQNGRNQVSCATPPVTTDTYMY